jgi:hypothetical protein
MNAIFISPEMTLIPFKKKNIIHNSCFFTLKSPPSAVTNIPLPSLISATCCHCEFTLFFFFLFHLLSFDFILNFAQTIFFFSYAASVFFFPLLIFFHILCCFSISFFLKLKFQFSSKVDSSCKKPLCICNSTFMALVI